MTDQQSSAPREWHYTHICAIDADGNSVWERPENPMHQLNIAHLRAAEARSKAHFESVYQGNPSLLAGEIFKRQWFRYFRMTQEEVEEDACNGLHSVALPTDHVLVSLQASDLATSSKDLPSRGKAHLDFYARCNIFVDRASNIYVVDMWRAQNLTMQDRIHDIETAAARWNPDVIGIETIAFQSDTFHAAVERSTLPYVEIKPHRDKTTRFWGLQPRYEMLKVYHLRDAPWLQWFEPELEAVPHGKHDDGADTLVMCHELSRRYGSRAAAGRVAELQDMLPRGIGSTLREW